MRNQAGHVGLEAAEQWISALQLWMKLSPRSWKTKRKPRGGGPTRRSKTVLHAEFSAPGMMKMGAGRTTLKRVRWRWRWSPGLRPSHTGAGKPEKQSDPDAVELLEGLGTPEVRKLLIELAGGAAGAPLTLDVAEALERPDSFGAISGGRRRNKGECRRERLSKSACIWALPDSDKLEVSGQATDRVLYEILAMLLTKRKMGEPIDFRRRDL